MISLLAAMTVTFATGANVHEGARLQAGDVIETQPDGRVELTFDSGTVLRIGESSRFELQDELPQKSFSAKLWLGNVWAKVHKLIAGETFRIETENAVAGVRGTEFRVEVAPDHENLVRVYEGVVQVDGKGWSQRVEPAHELRFGRDRAPSGPREFDPASEKGHRLMDWVRERREHRRNPEREQRRERRLR